MSNSSFADIGDDLHVLVTVSWKPASGRDDVVIPDPKSSPVHSTGITIGGEGEVVSGLEPPMVGGAEAGEGAKIDHGGTGPGF